MGPLARGTGRRPRRRPRDRPARADAEPAMNDDDLPYDGGCLCGAVR
jgi:hypothetical protein